MRGGAPCAKMSLAPREMVGAGILWPSQDLLGNLNNSNVNALKSGGQNVSEQAPITVNADSKLYGVLLPPITLVPTPPAAWKDKCRNQ